MRFARRIVFLAAALAGVSVSGVTVQAEERAPDTSTSCPYRPTHSVPLAMTSDDYPLLSIAQNEQGTVVLDFLIKPDGSIADVKVARSSGFARLDGAAVDAAKQRWHFDPVLVNGKPVSCRNRVGVAWKMDWSPEQLEQSGFPVVRLGASDYPPGSLAKHESGMTLVMALVSANGKITHAIASQSSGSAELDAKAIDYVESGRWQVAPAQVSGKAVTAMIGFIVIWSP
jgi:TonB family protein